MVRKEAIDEFQTVMPEEEDMALVHSVNTKSDELSNIVELCFTCRYMPWVDVHAFEAGEEKFTRRSTITMRSKQHERKPELGCNFLKLF